MKSIDSSKTENIQAENGNSAACIAAKMSWTVGSPALLERAAAGLIRPMKVYDDLSVDFLDDLSRALRGRAQGKYPDVASVAFWCRRANVIRMKKQYGQREKEEDRLAYSLGRGLIFHITPSNVPVNFAFSYFFGLLGGNANIVRLPSKEYGQVDMLCSVIGELLLQDKYRPIRENTAFVRYGHEQEITDYLCSVSDGRIIWGGDDTIHRIRGSLMKPKGVEVVFADRYSLGVLDSASVAAASEEELERLAGNFYNDTYLMDQNACSTPHLILWQGADSEAAQKRFWEAVFKAAGKYDLEPIKAVDKYTDLMLACMEEDSGIGKVTRFGNLLYVIDMKELPKRLERLRGRFGMFYQYRGGLKSITELVDERVQTLMYYGIDKEEIAHWVIDNRLTGVDRIVPFGSSLDMNVNWDGYDIVRQLSRQIIFE